MALSRRTRVNFILEGCTLAVLLGLIATGLTLEFRLPPGTGGGGRNAPLLLSGLGRHEWGEIHFYLSLTFIALMLAHLALHWRWIWAVARGGEHKKLRVGGRGAGFIALTTGMLLMVALPWLMPTSVGDAEQAWREGGGRHRRQRGAEAWADSAERATPGVRMMAEPTTHTTGRMGTGAVRSMR